MVSVHQPRTEVPERAIVRPEPFVSIDDQQVRCELCGTSVQGRFLEDHKKVHRRPKATKSRKKKRGSGRNEVWLVPGGLPSLGKKR